MNYVRFIGVSDIHALKTENKISCFDNLDIYFKVIMLHKFDK